MNYTTVLRRSNGRPSTKPTGNAMELRVENLTVRYPGKGGQPFVALDDVSVTARPGSLITLLGPSGSGKTTLLRSLAGLVEAQQGRIRFGDRTVFDNGRSVPTRERHLGMVFQSFALWPHMSVAKNVAYPLKLQRWGAAERRRRADELLDSVGLDGLGDRRPGELSGGQQQRVGLARAIAHQPGVLLMDEPLSNLDAQLREEMRLLIKTLQEGRTHTTVYVTHDRTEALALSDVVYILRQGKVVASGTPTELYTDPRDAFTARFLADWNHVCRIDLAPPQARAAVEANRRRPCVCDGHCVVMLPRTASFQVGTGPDDGRPGSGTVRGVVLAREFVGNLVQLDARLPALDATVRLTADVSTNAAAASDSELTLGLSELRLLCAPPGVVPRS